jgi:hypothetical protein
MRHNLTSLHFAVCSCDGPESRHGGRDSGPHFFCTWKTNRAVNCLLSLPRSKTNAVSKSGHCTYRRRDGSVADQQIYSDGFEHQNDIKRRRDDRRWSVGVAGDGAVGTDFQLSAFPLTGRPGPEARATVAEAGLAWRDGRRCLIRYTRRPQRTHRQGTISGQMMYSARLRTSERCSLLLKQVSQVFDKSIMSVRNAICQPAYIWHTSEGKHRPGPK